MILIISNITDFQQGYPSMESSKKIIHNIVWTKRNRYLQITEIKGGVVKTDGFVA